ncbi:hypothetical protein BC937DRAFT_89318 [Endogone sp. FLAS-F59071]|nr:hypothetical protein BC937DRAFT_89318 [Endogone sp. FLAS-F59071]|eukprot:RUS22411.1 hypothetical protein BC937DRAFT_89318 [Endogone sp. FLAS-F59071]
MAPFYARPENALKRSEELIAVGQHGAALQTLHDVVISKRSRSVPLANMEPIMLKFVELCVNLRKGKLAKEGLHQYKNIAQNTSVSTIEVRCSVYLVGYLTICKDIGFRIHTTTSITFKDLSM